MGVLERYRQLTQQANLQPTEVSQPQQPQIDTSDPINSLAGMLVTPAEREAQEQKMLRNKRRMIAWTGLFDGLRNLGNLYAVSQGAAPQKYTDNPYQTIEQSYQQERKRQNDIFDYRDNYAKQLWNLQRQFDQDKIRQEAHKAQMDYYKAREDETHSKTQREEQLAHARDEYWKAMAQKNTEQAEYWRLKALGVPDESAAKIAKDNALAAKANRTGGSNGRSGNQEGSETIVTEGYDENGNKVKKTVKQPRKNSSSSGNSKNTYDNTRKLGL